MKIDYRKPKWMTPKIFAASKKRSKLSKKYYANPSKVNKEELHSYSKYCTEIITDAKDKFLNRLNVQLGDSNTSAKSCWSIINNFLNNKKICTLPPLCLMVLYFQILKELRNYKQKLFLCPPQK